MLGATMLIPLAISLIMGEQDIACNYLIGIGCAAVIGGLLRMCRISTPTLQRRHAIAITVLVWVAGAAISAVPLLLSGHYGSYLDAFFESVSGLTTSGFSLCQDVDHLSMADNMWRFTLHYLGGQGVVVMALSLGIFNKVASSFYSAEGRNELIMTDIRGTARFIFRFSFTVVLCGTIVLFIIILTLGMDPVRSLFNSLWLTISAYDTGGFTPQSPSIIYYHSWALEIDLIVVMLMGAVNFALYARMQKRNIRQIIREFTHDIEIKTLAALILIMLMAFVLVVQAGGFFTNDAGMLRRGIFTIVSLETSTGFSVLTTSQLATAFSSGAVFILIGVMAIGGSSDSTAGGIKALRLGIIIKSTIVSIKEHLSPKSVRNTTAYQHLGRQLLTSNVAVMAMTIALLYLITYIIGALAGILAGNGAVPSLFDSVAATTNSGISTGLVSPDTPTVLKIIYILQMWVGRLEFLTFLAVVFGFIASFKPLLGRAKRLFKSMKKKAQRDH